MRVWFLRLVASLAILAGTTSRGGGTPVRAPRLSFGRNVPPGSAPWFLTVRVRIGNGYVDCGGSVIASDVVLTAAHCVYSTKPPDGVYLVDPRTEKEVEGLSGIAINVPDAWKDPIRMDFTGDLAVIRFNIPIGITDLPVVAGKGWSSRRVAVLGRGLTEFGTNSEGLEYIVVPVLTDKRTKRLLDQAGFDGEDDHMAKGRKKLPRDNQGLESDHFGAGDLRRDSCQGDSGGPALKSFNRRGKRDVLVGVVSYGPSLFACGERGSFGLYTVRPHRGSAARALAQSLTRSPTPAGRRRARGLAQRRVGGRRRMGAHQMIFSISAPLLC